jgi:hypothetical protein
VQIRWQSTDLSILETDPLTPGAPAWTSNAHQASNSTTLAHGNTGSSIFPTPTFPVSSHHLSSGAKIGIGIAIPVFVLLLLSLSIFFILRKRKLKPTHESQQEYRKAELEAHPSPLNELPNSQATETVLCTKSPDLNEITELDSIPISTRQVEVEVQRKKPIANQAVVLSSDLGVGDAVEGTVQAVELEESRCEPL